ncbi:MAG: disulfide bond formation protein B [Ilumatobacter sp.]|uniref:disulfide bond formation protein B n=1 Tax=Ilumatobacter sp. TaxID=1967498 RepID=UPI00260A8C8E|nr:disulfide bond formation protein B [Ilumatobacter sp.]MDJ0770369.1 disulfide bond formation protein B [Ilumatobacter sp.]
MDGLTAFLETATSVLALVAGAGAVLIVAARVLAPRLPIAARLGGRVVAWRAELTLAVAGVSTLGSLYFSEVADYVPCRLCWYQRIAMYPIAVVAVVALIRRDGNARFYVAPMALVGAGISGYHYLIERGVLRDTESCGLFGPACADVWFEEFGFVTLAFMALAGFVAILVVNLVPFPASKESS